MTNMTGSRILIVDDEEQFVRMLRATLASQGYEVSAARSGREALVAVQSQAFDLLLLDLNLPDMDGQSIIEAYRGMSAAPIIVVSVRSSEQDKVQALDQGANDYVCKPFEVEELLARIRVALRGLAKTPDPPLIRLDQLELDVRTRRAAIGSRVVRLSGKETELLRILAMADGEIVSHEALIEGIWGPASDADFQNLRVLVWQARHKIENDAADPRYLMAETGLGYRLTLGALRDRTG